MPEETKKPELPDSSRGSGIDRGVRLSSHTVQCTACSRLSRYSETHPYCMYCGGRLTLPSYSGQGSAEILTGAEGYNVNAPVRRRETRRWPRIPCRNVKACVRTETIEKLIVDVLNLSRGGICFVSSEFEFLPGTQAFVALHYIEGGQNIFQEARVVWALCMTEEEYPRHGVEFAAA